jgi:hypothetical protein
MTLDLLSKTSANAGKFWPWSKKRVEWVLSIDGDSCIVSITYSSKSKKSRLFVNRVMVTCGEGGDFEYAFNLTLDFSAIAIVSNSKPSLEVEGWPVEWLSPRIRREQAQGLSLFATPETSTASSNIASRPFFEMM